MIDLPCVYLSEKWVLEQYYGWRVIDTSETTKTLLKRHTLYDKVLVVARRGLSEEQLRPIAEISTKNRLVSLHLKIIEPDADLKSLTVRMQQTVGDLRPCPNDGRMFHRCTILVKLSHELSRLRSEMTAKGRNSLKRAEQSELRVEFADSDTDGHLPRFEQLYGRVIGKTGRSLTALATLRAMLINGNLLIACLRAGDETQQMALIYRTKSYAYFLLGAGVAHPLPGAGQLLHWKIIERLKQDGAAWYDLGGVPSTDRSDGIYNFKSSLGGQLVRYGGEYIHESSLLSLPRSIGRSLRGWFNGV